MDIAQVRSFNRTVTERVGALQETYLDLGRPLGANRVLWEITEDGTDLRTLRARLGLDSGYLSRLIASLQREGLVETAPGADKRVRRVSLTAAGRAERAVLDRRSDELAADLLAPLSERQRSELVTAMATVERLLTAGLVEITEDDQQSPDAQFCLREYYKELDARFEGGFDVANALPTDDATFIVARLRGEPVGCGAIKLKESYIKRMWVSPAVRGLGLGKRLLRELEQRSQTGVARLETNRALTEAIALYRSLGYVEVEPFNDERYAHHWFERRL
jgi:DNA-binding MarR family transcriptional regulator/ribosomal protein S18 acetylase RimI-like enzyme